MVLKERGSQREMTNRVLTGTVAVNRFTVYRIIGKYGGDPWKRSLR